MKSEERHHLEQNDLADWLRRTIENARPYVPLGLGVVALVVVVVVSIGYFNQASRMERHNAWIDFLNAENDVAQYRPQGEDAPSAMEFGAKRFDEIAAAYSDPQLSTRAKMRATDYRFEDAKSLLINDRAKAAEKLTKVIDSYGALAQNENAPEEVRKQSLYSQGLALESRGSLTKAKEVYERVASKYEVLDKELAFVARQRAEKMADPQVQSFYAQLEEYEPKTPSLDLPDAQTPETPMIPFPPGGVEKGASKASDLLPDLNVEKIDVPIPPKTDEKESGKNAEAPAKTDAAKSDGPKPKEAEASKKDSVSNTQPAKSKSDESTPQKPNESQEAKSDESN